MLARTCRWSSINRDQDTADGATEVEFAGLRVTGP